MKIRLIIITLALLALSATVTGGIMYYYSVRNNALMEIHKDADAMVAEIAGRVSRSIDEYQKIAAAAAGLKEIRKVMEVRQPSLLAAANEHLDQFQSVFGIDVCYLIDRSGMTIASTNRAAPDSFVGKNYAFRPYFISALSGRPTVYMALGVTSGKRGVYCAQPVYGAGSQRILGVLVVKTSINSLESEITKKPDGIVVVSDPEGVVFLASKDGWFSRVLWQLPDKTLNAIAETNQFGKGPLAWTGMKLTGAGNAVDEQGREYRIHEAQIASYPGWKIVYLHDLAAVADQASAVLYRGYGFVVIVLVIVIGGISVVLYRKANIEILKRKHAEDELKNRNDMLQTMIKASPLPITAIDAEGNTILWNPAAERVFGWTGQEVLGQPTRIVPSDLREEHIDFRSRVLDDDSITGVETRRMKKDGTLIDVAVSSASIRDDQGTGVAAMGIYEDITERKKAEDEVRFLAAIIQNFPEAVCAVDTTGAVVTWNAGAEKLLGYRAEEIIGKPITTVIPNDIAQLELGHCFAILNSAGHFSGYESVRLTKDGRQIPIDLTAVVIKNSRQEITHYASIMVDLSERKIAEKERMKAHMLESIGLLAGGIAHDFNNLLTALLGNIYIAKNALEPDCKAFTRLTDAEGVCELASELSRRLITFSTGGDPIRKIRSLSRLIEDTVIPILKSSPIEVELVFANDLRDAAIDEGQMRQVFMNLVKNAQEAMPTGGKLTIRTENIHVGEEDTGPIKPGEYIRISIQDTGAGIPSENLAKIFDPYYTTKDTYNQKGLGLGLAVCYSVIKRHDGLITVESTVGEGTTFRIIIPAVDQWPMRQPQTAAHE